MVRGNLAEELLKLREEEGISFQEAGARSGIARSTISQVVNQGLRGKGAAGYRAGAAGAHGL